MSLCKKLSCLLFPFLSLSLSLAYLPQQQQQNFSTTFPFLGSFSRNWIVSGGYSCYFVGVKNDKLYYFFPM